MTQSLLVAASQPGDEEEEELAEKVGEGERSWGWFWDMAKSASCSGRFAIVVSLIFTMIT